MGISGSPDPIGALLRTSPSLYREFGSEAREYVTPVVKTPAGYCRLLSVPLETSGMATPFESIENILKRFGVDPEDEAAVARFMRDRIHQDVGEAERERIQDMWDDSHKDDMTNIKRIAGTAAGVGATLFLGAPAQGQPTPVDQLVIYGVDADTHELLRYVFDDDSFTRIGVITDQNGYVIDHPEGFTYIPNGPDKGFYAVSTHKDDTGGPQHTLAKINGMDATCVMYPSQLNYRNVRGMTTVPDGAGGWTMYAVSHNNWINPSLVEIDPATGVDTQVLDLTHFYAAFNQFEGLSQHPDPNFLYILTGWELVECDLRDGSLTLVADHSVWARTESLEIAFGDNGQKISIPGVPGGWTNNGALFGFSDSKNKLLVYDRDGGAFSEYACSFVTVDCEGLVFMTQLQDPYGKIVVYPRD